MVAIYTKLGITDNLPCQQLAQQDAETPDVSLEGVTVVDDELGRRVANGSTVSGSPVVFILGQLLCEAKVYQFNMTFHVDHHIIRLNVPVDDLPLVEEVNGHQHLRSVEGHPGPTWVFLSISALFLTQFQIMLIVEDPEEVLSRQILEHEVHIYLVREGLD